MQSGDVYGGDSFDAADRLIYLKIFRHRGLRQRIRRRFRLGSTGVIMGSRGVIRGSKGVIGGSEGVIMGFNSIDGGIEFSGVSDSTGVDGFGRTRATNITKITIRITNSNRNISILEIDIF